MDNNQKGIEFEKRTGAWIKRALREAHAEVKTRVFARGYMTPTPFEVDVHVELKVPSFPVRKSRLIWIECKCRENTRVNKSEIQLLIMKAKDVWQAYLHGMGPGYDGLMFAATSGYDANALKYASALGVMCAYYNGNSFKIENDLWNTWQEWLNERRWEKV